MTDTEEFKEELEERILCYWEWVMKDELEENDYQWCQIQMTINTWLEL